jgi:lamin tail-like protein
MKPRFVFVLLASLGCSPDLAADPCAAKPATVGPIEVSAEPAAALDALPPVVWLRVRAVSGGALDPTAVYLVEGEVGPAHLGQIARDEISKALRERIVPAIVWPDGDEVVVAPTRALVPGAHAIAMGAPKAAVELQVAAEDPVPLLALSWPPGGASAGDLAAVWCGAALPPIATPILLEPLGIGATVRNGTQPGSGALGCVHLEATGEVPEGSAVVAPPLLADAEGAVLARPEPAALRTDAEAAPVVSLACEAGEERIGPGCASVADDRILLRTPDAPLLWTFADGVQLDLVAPSAGDALLVWPLPPAADLLLSVGFVDLAGAASALEVPIHTLAPMAHVIVNEVLANPLGPEPAQEWVELYNDGLAPADLAGWILADVAGESLLPEVILGPGAFAVVVNEDYDASGEYDAAPAPDALVITVPAIGKNGLANDGEPLKLVDAGGVVVSRFPPLPKPKAGKSVARVQPKAVDALVTSFVLADTPTPGTPN